MKKTLLKTIYNLGGFAAFRRANRRNLCVLMYHRFSREPDAAKISAREFAAHLAYLKKHCRVLPLAEIVQRLKTGAPLPPNAAAITIDDGYADAFEIAFPLLEKYDLPATVYAVTDFLDGKIWIWTDLMRYALTATKKDCVKIEFAGDDCLEIRPSGAASRAEAARRINARLKKMPDAARKTKIGEIAADLKVYIPGAPTEDFAPVTWTQARRMDAGGVRVESHTATHPILTNVTSGELAAELRASKARLENQLNREIKDFCYPNGDFDAAVRQAVEAAGYESAVSTRYGFNAPKADRFALKRIDAPAAIENFAQSASGFEAFRLRIKN